MNTRLCLFGCLLFVCSNIHVWAAEIYTSSRQITSLACSSDSTIWASTKGGVLQRKPDGTWCKFTIMNGLPSNEIASVAVENKQITAITSEAAAVYMDGRWSVSTTHLKQSSKLETKETASTIWLGKECTATITELRIKENDKWRIIKLPPGRGSHISALLPKGDHLWAAMFGDGIWEHDGKNWSRLNVNPPPAAREITCMIQTGSFIWIGTRNEGLWQYDGKKWTQTLFPDEPYNHNCQSIISYNGDVYISTLEDGLVVKTSKGWIRYSNETLSSNAPRQMVISGNRLYVRHGDGKVDRYDGKNWTRNVCADILRKQVSALASTGNPLYVCQWGGWSEFDGANWEHNLKIPELQGYPITAISPRGNTLWIGTQGRGLAEYDTVFGKLTWHDETNGMPDDWIKVISDTNPMLVGTFVGGLSIKNGNIWNSIKEFNSMEITAIISNFPANGSFIGTRNGLFYRTDDGKITSIKLENSPIKYEVQALCRTGETLWVGTRTGLYSVPTPFYEASKPFYTIINK